MTGPPYSSVHEGTDALLYPAWNSTLNSYRFGVDVELLPRTVISYDQFLDYYKGDTTWRLAPFAPALLPGTGGTVELGLPIDTANKAPCAINPPATSLIDSTGMVNAGNCTVNGYNDTKNPLLTDERYTNSTHHGMVSVMFKPATRVTAQVGCSITSTAGQTPQFNSLQPLGSLQYDYHQPMANLAADMGHNLTTKVGWNYYQYGEGSFVGPTNPQYFHATMRHFPRVGLSSGAGPGRHAAAGNPKLNHRHGLFC